MKILTGPLILIASALFYLGSVLAISYDRGYSAYGGIPAAILLLIGLRITFDDRQRKD